MAIMLFLLWRMPPPAAAAPSADPVPDAAA